MSLMQQISVPSCLTWMQWRVNEELVGFWSDLDVWKIKWKNQQQGKELLINEKEKEKDKNKTKEKGKEKEKDGKEKSKKEKIKYPHNIHAALEFLFVDLPIFGLSMLQSQFFLSWLT